MSKPYYETKLGKLYHGDCLDIMPKLEPVDLVLTDPPYGTTACKWDVIIPFESMWKQLNRIIKKNGAIVLFGSEPFSSYLRMSNIKHYKYDWVWIKNQPTGMAFAKFQPMRDSENISIFYIKPPVYNKQETLSKVKDRETGNSNGKLDKRVSKQNNIIPDKSKNNPKNILRSFVNPRTTIYFNVHSRAAGMLHPTQKPVAIMEYLIKTYTNEGESVLDFTIGSGTTAIACECLKRKWIGIEIEEKYCEIAAKRIEENLTVPERIDRCEKGITKKTTLLF